MRMETYSQGVCGAIWANQHWPGNLPHEEAFRLRNPGFFLLVLEGRAEIQDQFGTAIGNDPLDIERRRCPLQKPVAMDEFSRRRTRSDLAVAHHQNSEFQKILAQFLSGIRQHAFEMKLN